MTATSLGSYFNSKHELLEEVVILPIGVYDGNDDPFSLPAGYSFTDFEYIEFLGTFSTNAMFTSDSIRLTKEAIAANPTNWKIRVNGSTNVANYADLEAINNSQFKFSANNPVGTGRLKGVVGYRRRYATQNVSAIVSVNGGANVGVNQRYEIDIATALGQDYVGKDLIVEAEVYADGTKGGVSGWGSAQWAYLSDSYGARATVVEDKIIVQTGRASVCATSAQSGNGFGNTAAFSNIPCRVKVWKVDQFVTSTFNMAALEARVAALEAAPPSPPPPPPGLTGRLMSMYVGPANPPWDPTATTEETWESWYGQTIDKASLSYMVDSGSKTLPTNTVENCINRYSKLRIDAVMWNWGGDSVTSNIEFLDSKGNTLYAMRIDPVPGVPYSARLQCGATLSSLSEMPSENGRGVRVYGDITISSEGLSFVNKNTHSGYVKDWTAAVDMTDVRSIRFSDLSIHDSSPDSTYQYLEVLPE